MVGKGKERWLVDDVVHDGDDAVGDGSGDDDGGSDDEQKGDGERRVEGHLQRCKSETENSPKDPEHPKLGNSPVTHVIHGSNLVSLSHFWQRHITWDCGVRGHERVQRWPTADLDSIVQYGVIRRVTLNGGTRRQLDTQLEFELASLPSPPYTTRPERRWRYLLYFSIARSFGRICTYVPQTPLRQMSPRICTSHRN